MPSYPTFIVFGGTGIWTHGLSLAKHSVTQATHPALIEKVIFQVGFYIFFAQASLPVILLLIISAKLENTDVCHLPSFFIEMGVWLTFCPSWSETSVLQISDQGPGVTEMSHCTTPSFWNLFDCDFSGSWQQLLETLHWQKNNNKQNANYCGFITWGLGIVRISRILQNSYGMHVVSVGSSSENCIMNAS
jgi:hypothetical protein